jgi:RimJ/RimL family protein N-acetyltransferase
MPNFENPTPRIEQKRTPADVASLQDFDPGYFKKLEGEKGWIAIGQENCRNQKYFTVLGTSGEKLGIVGVYDTDDEKNVTHTVVDPKYRGQGLAVKFKDRLMDELGLDSITLTIDLNNESSLKATQKMPGVRRVSDEQYEQEFHKAKFIYEKTDKV